MAPASWTLPFPLSWPVKPDKQSRNFYHSQVSTYPNHALVNKNLHQRFSTFLEPNSSVYGAKYGDSVSKKFGGSPIVISFTQNTKPSALELFEKNPAWKFSGFASLQKLWTLPWKSTYIF